MFLNSNSHKVVIGLPFGVEQGRKLLEQVSRECLDALLEQEVVRRSRDGLSNLVYQQLLQVGRLVSGYSNALEALEGLDIDVPMEEFQGEI